LREKNKAFLYVLSWVWYVEKFIEWLNKNKKGYEILEKIYNYVKLNDEEKMWIKNICIGDYTLVNEENNEVMPTNIGNAVYIRYKRRSTEHRIQD